MSLLVVPHYTIWLVVWNMFFPYIGNMGIIIPTDSYFSEGLKPPTRQQSQCGIVQTIQQVSAVFQDRMVHEPCGPGPVLNRKKVNWLP